MAKRLAAALQPTARVVQIDAARKRKMDVLHEHDNLTDAVLDDVIRRGEEHHDLVLLREHVLVARRDLVEDQRAKRIRERLDGGIVAAQESGQLARRLPARHVVCSAVESWRKKSSASFF